MYSRVVKLYGYTKVYCFYFYVMSKNEKLHQGKLISKIVKQSGYRVTWLAGKLGMSRHTLYNRFQTEDLSDDFVLRIGRLIYYDFAKHFTLDTQIHEEVEEAPIIYGGVEEKPLEDSLEEKYILLLEKYNHLVLILTDSIIKYPHLQKDRRMTGFIKNQYYTAFFFV